MDNRWPDYACLPATGIDFERYVGTVLEDLGYDVRMTPASNDYGVDLVLTEPATGKRIAVQTKFFSRGSLGNEAVQQVVAGKYVWDASESWVITNAKGFTANAQALAQANDVKLIGNVVLNGLVAFAASLKASSASAAMPQAASAAAPAAAAPMPCAAPTQAGYLAPAQLAHAGQSFAFTGQPTSIAQPAPAPAAYGAVGPSHAAAPDASYGYQPGGFQGDAAYAPQMATAMGPLPSASAPMPAVSGMGMPVAPGMGGMRTYTLTDVRMRWNCSDAFVREQMSRGLPLYKQPNGQYAISEPDLFGWEQIMMAPQYPMQSTPKRRVSLGWLWTLLFLLLIVAILAAYIFLAPPLFDAIEADNPGLHIMRWTDIVEKLMPS